MADSVREDACQEWTRACNYKHAFDYALSDLFVFWTTWSHKIAQKQHLTANYLFFLGELNKILSCLKISKQSNSLNRLIALKR